MRIKLLNNKNDEKKYKCKPSVDVWIQWQHRTHNNMMSSRNEKACIGQVGIMMPREEFFKDQRVENTR
jgi:hypothetical protein